MSEAKEGVLIEIDNASVVKDGRSILVDVSLRICRGENVAILGPNGAGKSSLVKLITKEYYPVCEAFATPVKIYGKSSWDVFTLRRHMGIVTADLQTAYNKDYTAAEAVLSGFFSSIGVHGHHKVSEDMKLAASNALAFLGMDRYAAKPMNKLSIGEARKVLIARALVNDPQVLILDEPTSGLDVKAAHGFLNALRKVASSDKNVILITHRINEIIPEIGRVVMMKDGKVFLDGRKEEVLTSRNVSALFDIDVEVHGSDGYYSIAYK